MALQRQVVCYRIPHLQIALARLHDSSLRSRPFAIASSVQPDTPILDVSDEARRDGVVTGMQIGGAKRLCPALRIVPSDSRTVQAADTAVLHVIARFAPIWEPVRPGHVYLDLTGTRRLFGVACDTAAKIEMEIAERFSLHGVAGVASNKLVSSVAATLVRPLQLYDVRPGAEPAFLAPLSIATLPLGYAQRRFVQTVCADVNVSTLGHLASLMLADLEPLFGSLAPRIHAWAKGIDETPVSPVTRRLQLDATVKLDGDDIERNRLEGYLYGLLETICGELRLRNTVCSRFALQVQYRDGREVDVQGRLAPGSYWEADVAPLLLMLLRRCLVRRVRVCRLTIVAMELQAPMVQLTLFDHAPSCLPSHDSRQARRDQFRKLSVALDAIRKKFWPHAIEWAHTRHVLHPSSRPF